MAVSCRGLARIATRDTLQRNATLVFAIQVNPAASKSSARALACPQGASTMRRSFSRSGNVACRVFVQSHRSKHGIARSAGSSTSVGHKFVSTSNSLSSAVHRLSVGGHRELHFRPRWREQEEEADEEDSGPKDSVEIEAFLSAFGQEQYADNFKSWSHLARANSRDLKAMGIPVRHRKMIMRNTESWRAKELYAGQGLVDLPPNSPQRKARQQPADSETVDGEKAQLASDIAQREADGESSGDVEPVHGTADAATSAGSGADAQGNAGEEVAAELDKDPHHFSSDSSTGDHVADDAASTQVKTAP